LQNPIQPGRSSIGAGLRDWIWVIGAAMVLAAGLHCSRLPSIATAFRVPATPLDWTSERGARLWAFLTQARDVVPPGVSYTVQGQNPDDEMNLYMFSLGLFFKQEALPSSYFGVATPGPGCRARFVLVYGAAFPRGGGRLIRKFGEGAVYERAA